MEATARPFLYRARRLLTAGFAAALFGLVVGGKWATIDRFGTDMPNWDQWDAEASELLIPWFEHDHFARHLFHPHNEHRVILTKLQNFALTVFNGQWDARLETVTNAMLHAALAVGFWLLARRWVRARWHGPLFVFTALLFGLPLATENVLSGFHSQQYWLLGLSFVVLVTLPFARPWTSAWWMGAAAAILVLGSMASGFFAVAVAAAIVVIRLWRRETTLRDAWPIFMLAAVLVVVGLVTRVDMPAHASLKARSAPEFLLYIIRSLAWPLRGQDWTGALLWCPWLLVAWRTIFVRPEGSDTRFGQIVTALGGWVLLQLFATAYARGADANYPASRYTDTVVFGAMVNAIALAALLSPRQAEDRPGLRSSPAPTSDKFTSANASINALGGVWLLAFGTGLYQQVERNFDSDLPSAKRYYFEGELHLRGYLATDDRAHLAFSNIPYPSADALVERLSHSSLRALMPAGIQPPLPLLAAPDVSPVFRENNASQLGLENEPRHGLSPATGALGSLPTWGSFGTDGAAATGQWMSAPISSLLGDWLKIETAGQLGEPGVTLELHDATTGVLLSTVRASKIPGDTWRAAYVRAPHRPFVMVARDTDATRWLAFSGPVEMGFLSYWAWQAARNGALLVWVSAIAVIILAIAALVLNRVGREGSKMFSLSPPIGPPETPR